MALFFTSGTTGPSKAVATTWHYLFTAAATVASSWELGSGDVLWTAMPLFHLSAAPTVLAPMLVGGTRCWPERSTRTRCGTRYGLAVPWVSPVRVRWCRCCGTCRPIRATPNSVLRFISAAPIAADMYRDIEERYRCRIVTMYGMTEAFPIAYKAVSDDGKPGTSGRVNPAFDVQIVNRHGQPVPQGTVGEIACRARTPHAMSEGYVSSASGGPRLQIDPHPEWFRTGDLGVLDTDDNLTYVDRVKDSLRRRGENISSVEVEQTVMRHPAVLEAAAVGVPSDLGEDDILVVVTLRPGAVVEYSELLDFCSARMPYFCVPRYLEVLDEIPKNVIGRVRKDVLRSRGLGVGAWDREAHGYMLSR